MAINALRDPLQGYDIRVKVTDIVGGATRLAGAFNSCMWRTISQTEAYLMLGSRVPRMLDGEIITVWSLDQGLVELDVVANTFGKTVADAFNGRGAVIPRQTRFNMEIYANTSETIATPASGFNEATFNPGGGDNPYMRVQLKYCRVDTLTFGVAPGKAVAANSWQGTAEGCDDGSSTAAPATTGATTKI
jgi:hypothetical protein